MASGDEYRGGLTKTASAPAAAHAETEDNDAATSTSRLDLAGILPDCVPSQFELGREIGRGGIGRVMRARDPVFDRPIAIKELLSRDSNARARFLREAMITARLQHPAIVPVYLAGRWPDGSPFYGMKLVEGKPLSEELRARKTLGERIALLPSVIATCEAIAFAHGHRIIHRDLKPSNVLLGELGETVVIDWGLAKDLDEVDAPEGAYGAVASASETVAGSVLGTPAYMPPEQGAGSGGDQRADVYSLGAILYELLAGVIPYATSKTARQILDDLAHGPPQPLAQLCPDAPRDLVAIAERAMARSPADRYRDARALAEDLRRFQAGQLVSVREYGMLERAARWIRRHRAAVIVAAAATVALVVIGAISVARTLRAQRRAEVAARVATSERDQALITSASAIVHDDPAAALATLAKLSPGSAQWSSARTIAADAVASRVPTFLPSPGFRAGRLELDARERVLVASEFTTGQAVIYDLATSAARRVQLARDERYGQLSPDGTAVATHSDAVAVIRIADGHRTRFDTGGARTQVARFSPSGEWLAASSADRLFVWPTAGGPGRSIKTPATKSLAVDDEGRLYAIDREAQQAHVFGTDGSDRVIPFPTRSAEQVARGADAWFYGSKRIVLITEKEAVAVIDVASGALAVLPDQRDRFLTANANDDASTIVGVTNDRVVRWELEAAGWRRVDELARTSAMEVRGATIVGGNTARLWVRRGGSFVSGRINAAPSPVALTRDGRYLYGVAPNGQLARWDLDGGDGAICGTDPYVALAATRWLLQQSGAGALGICDPITATQRVLHAGSQPIAMATPSRTFRHAVTRGETGEIVVWDITAGTGRTIALAAIPLAISDDGATLVVEIDRHLSRYDVASGQLTPVCDDFADGGLVAKDLSRAVRLAGDRLEICDLASGARSALPGYAGDVSASRLVLFGSLAYADGRAGAVLWNLHEGRRFSLDPGSREPVTRVEMMPDDRGVVVVGEAFVAVFDEHGKLVHSAAPASLTPSYVTASNDKRFAIVSDYVEHARLYDFVTKRSRVLEQPLASIGAGFIGDVIVTLDAANRIYRWTDDLPTDPAQVEAWVRRAAADIALDADGGSISTRRADGANK